MHRDQEFERELREQVEHARRELEHAEPEQREAAKQTLAAALRLFSQLILEGASKTNVIGLVVDGDPTLLEQARQTLNRQRKVFLASDAEQA